MIEIRKALNTYLKTLHPRVYYMDSPENAIFPYVVYDLQLYPTGEGEELVTLEIDGWDYNALGDPTVIETLMATINGYIDVNRNPTGLDKKTLVTDKIAVTFFNENKLGILDDDKNIKRKKYTYAARMIIK